MSNKEAVAHGAIMGEVTDYLRATEKFEATGCPSPDIPRKLIEGQRLTLRILGSYLSSKNGGGTIKLGPYQLTERVAIWCVVAYVVLAFRFGADPLRLFRFPIQSNGVAIQATK
jgi:hypothetical protein